MLQHIGQALSMVSQHRPHAGMEVEHGKAPSMHAEELALRSVATCIWVVERVKVISVTPFVEQSVVNPLTLELPRTLPLRSALIAECLVQCA